MTSPYEYIDDKLGVQSRYLFDGKDAADDSLRLISYRGFRSKVERKHIISLRRATTNTPALVRFDTLPIAWQEAIVARWGEARKLARKTLFERYYVRDMEYFKNYSSHQFDDGLSLSDEKRDEYTLNASVLITIGKIYTDRRALRKELHHTTRDIWSILSRECNAFKQIVPHTLPESEPRLRQLHREFTNEGYARLISGKFKNNNARKVSGETEALLNDVFSGTRQKPTASDVHSTYDGFLSGYVEVINNTTGELYNPKEFKKISEATVRNYLTKWENEIGTHAKRSGDRQDYMQRFKPYHSLRQPKHAGAIISIDDRQPPFEYSPEHRMWFYNGIDLGSEAFTCWVYGKTKEGIIIDFYRQMVRNYAQWGLQLPAELEGELSLNASFKDTFLREGNMFQYVRIEANNARGKRIERYYRDLRYGYEKKEEGWLARPHAVSEANQPRADKKQQIPYDKIVNMCLGHIAQWNNSPHSKIKDMSRWEVFLTMQHPNIQPTNYHGILPYLGYKERSSVRAGIIKFRNTEYLLGTNKVVSVGEELIKYMSQVESREIDIYWLDDNFGGTLKAHIYIDGRYVCDAVEKPSYNKARIEQTKEDIINRELMSKYVSTIEGYGRARKQSLSNVTVLDNRQIAIGSSFVMPGMRAPIETDTPAVVLPDIPTEEEEYLKANETSFKRDFVNTF